MVIRRDNLCDVDVELVHGFYLNLPLQAGIEFLAKRLEIYKERQNDCLELVAKAKTDIKCFLEALGALSDPAVQEMISANAI
ncbi:hypothetical protein GNI_111430 [Gregarina niphandrodes]|uniref:Prefoldin subunit n=1 Tax=Gregarina niphandrodes TaxID=110365 RepID=A0A023B3J9_GRENI|nr:hypothetical protein GNI_111430 [Gregarina niphandrodes]EZG55533.1 hypothetical protein GNI_111430 [Gregarina niphandrodes]|eukprot:XP_011131519.1 hypothetical protein GNI_111430 [Gregarina niphandrodes]